MSDLIKYAYALQAAGPRDALSEAAAITLLRDDALAWVHLDGTHAQARSWIEANLSYLDPHAISALLAEETRPRATRIGDGVLVILRGVNLNDGAEAEDMVSVRIWVDAQRVVSVARRRVWAVEDIAARIKAGESFDAGAFLALLAERLAVRIDGFGRELDDMSDDLEEEVAGTPEAALRRRLVDHRLRTITFRRYVAPQRDALEALVLTDGPLFLPEDRRRLQETHDRLTRLVEDLDAMRERLTVLREELAGQLSERLNRNMYLISVISAVFLPLGFLTGLFGVNVGGMPGVESPRAFWWLCGGMGTIVALQLLLLLRWRWV
ncbi:hypothetical protein A9Q95_16200 [Rhodobacterales bacterium 59_46_T64]|nr:hypothetical protein A9Q95_16200 [Rhodobacterales bacterium 59_46_T64]